MKENLFLLGLMGQEKRLLILQPAEQVGQTVFSIFRYLGGLASPPALIAASSATWLRKR